MDRFRIKTPFCGTGDLRSVSITAGFVYLIFALEAASTGFGYKSKEFGYGFYGENNLLMLLGISSIVWFISNILLIYGAIQRQHTFVLPWIYWQLVFVVVALMVLIWSSVVMANLRNSLEVEYRQVMDAMTAALCCIVPFLFTVIYCFIVVYSFYCDLKEVKSTRDRPDTSVSPAYENVTSTGHSTSQRAIPFLREREKHIHDVRTHTAPNFHVTSSSNITSHRPPAIPPQTEHTYADVQKRPVLNNLRSDAVKSEEGEVNVVIEHVLPAKFSGTNHFN